MSRLLEALRDDGIELVATADGKLRVKAEVATLSAERKAEIVEHRDELLAALEAEHAARAKDADKAQAGRERRRAAVLDMLAGNATARYAWLTEPDRFGDIIVALAIRDVGTCELWIAKKRYDVGHMLELLGAAEASP